MADNFVQYCEELGGLTLEQHAWLVGLVALLDPAERDEGREEEAVYAPYLAVIDEATEDGDRIGFGSGAEKQEDGTVTWTFEDDGCGDIDVVLYLVQSLFKHFNLDRTWTLTWAGTCSKARPGQFGGGVAVVTKEQVMAETTWTRAANLVRLLEEEKAE